MVLDLNAEAADCIFRRDERWHDCTNFFREKGFLVKADRVFCADSVRAYVEWVYNAVVNGWSFPPEPDTLMFSQEELHEIQCYLDILYERLKEAHPDKATKIRKLFKAAE